MGTVCRRRVPLRMRRRKSRAGCTSLGHEPEARPPGTDRGHGKDPTPRSLSLWSLRSAGAVICRRRDMDEVRRVRVRRVRKGTRWCGGGVLTVALLVTPGGLAAQTPDGLPEVLPRDFETRAALSAAPVELRDGAGVWLLREGGFEQARESTNGYHCLVQRDLTPDRPADRQLFAPQCFDRESARTLMRTHVLRSSLVRAEGLEGDAVAERLERHATELTPTGAGLIYMASSLNTQPDPSSPGEAFRNYMPHVMFLAPHWTDADINGGRIASVGTDAFFDGWPFRAGAPRAQGLLILPLDRDVRERIYDEQRELVEELGRYLPRRAAVGHGGS